jgi:hypothetical protein
MPELSHIDPRSAALLVMDYQVDTLTKFMTAAQSADAIIRLTIRLCSPTRLSRSRLGRLASSSFNVGIATTLQ